jgi:hypothetical protein
MENEKSKSIDYTERGKNNEILSSQIKLNKAKM